MRILSSFVGGRGHWGPMEPIGRAAVRAGHTVRVACGESMVSQVRQDGFEAWPAGPDFGGGGIRRPLIKPDQDKEDRDLRDGFADRAARIRAAHLLETDWRPDLILCDEVDFGAMIAAEVLGIPYASVLSNASGSFVRASVIGEALNEVRADHGLPADPGMEMLSRHLVLSPFPPSLRHPGFPLPPSARTFRAQDVVEAKPEEPTIYFTLGTVFNTESGDLFPRVLAGLRELPLRLIVTVGPYIDPAEFGPQPEHVRIEKYIPQHETLPQCSLVVSHGGSGSMTGTIAHGLPTVLIPMGADQILNAARAADLGFGRILDAFTATSAEVKATVVDVLDDRSYRQAATRLRDELADQPDTVHAIRLLEGLVERQR
ncbi:glycosyltransferase [Kibdelosporangium philippinense]|uniref:Glycosyltransferase n=2 Tax=Kibdelosporangium philippinense TaxID=211113 RepID=A0ABS8ZFX7_9PSEU|nr:glycosyltransferase [Kibdelosporangium philippinense]MCE7006437.1 glycosyltransferase [Kibdelosporangium philippinense]